MIKIPIPKPPKAPTLHKLAASKVADSWKSEVAQQNRRIGGVTPKVLRSYAEAPAKYIPRSRGLLARMAGKGAGTKEAVHI